MHPHAFLAARAARCAGDQDRYWPYHDALFQNQGSWTFITAPPARQFVSYAEGLGLDGAEFESCLRSDRHAEVVTANLYLAMELNLPGTPSILMQGPNDRLPRRVDFATLESIFEAIVAEVEAIQGTQGARGAEG
jgi:protein-disulfide isomerase